MAAYRELDADAVDWANVEFWFGDERFVGIDLPDRNDGQARDAFLDRVGATRVHSLADNDCSLSAADAAAPMPTTLPTEPFDLTLLGVGPDGHIASLCSRDSRSFAKPSSWRSPSSTPPSRHRCASP